jgi:hypothetical protein
VENPCETVAVIHRGRVVASGAVAGIGLLALGQTVAMVAAFIIAGYASGSSVARRGDRDRRHRRRVRGARLPAAHLLKCPYLRLP